MKRRFPSSAMSPAVRLLYALILVAVTLFASSLTASAQDARARILGKITDSSGAVIPGAKVTVTNIATNVKTEVTSDGQGNYQALALPIGTYIVSVEKAGFKTTTTEKITLEINQEAKTNIALPVGASTESVEVVSTATEVDTQSATIGDSVTARPIVNLPLNGRNVLDLALLQPGVSETNADSGAAGGFSIAGGRTDSVTYLLDGGNNNNLLSNGVVVNPNPDAIAEFRILENNYNAEYGRNGGGVISVVQKSGTNAIHGSAFDFVRNDAFNANSYFNKRKGISRDTLKRNQFGGVIGGPITIPHVVNGKDRMFWFFSYQGQRLTDGLTGNQVTVPTPAELGGDFSHAAMGAPDPKVVTFLGNNPYYQPNPALAAQAIIDPTRISSVAQKYLKAGLIPSDPSGQLTPRGTAIFNSNEYGGKFDFNITEKDRLSVTLNRRRAPSFEPFDGPQDNPLGFPSVSTFPVNVQSNSYFFNAAYTKTFTPTLLNDFRVTAQRANLLQAKPAKNYPTASQLGVGITPDQPTGPPILGFLDSGLTLGFSPQGPTSLINNTFAYNDTLTWVKGRHTMKYGFEFSPYQNNTLFDFYVNGEFFFYGSQTQTDPNTGIQVASGNEFADLLFGTPDEFLQFGSAPSNIRSKSYYGFAQDEWRVTDHLTLTYGLRYEYSSPKLDTKQRSFSLKLGQTSTVFTNAPVGLLFPGDKGAPLGANLPDKNDFAPRFGFAYDPAGTGKTVIRGGGGLFYDILKGEDNLQYNGQAPFFGSEDIFPVPVFATTTELNYLSQPFVAAGAVNTFPSKPPAKNIDFAASGFLPFGGGGVFFVDPKLRTPYVWQYNLGIQQQFAAGTVGEVAYVGSLGRKLTSLVDSNPFTLGTTTRIFNAQAPGPNGVAPFFSYLDTFRNVGNVEYNSLQASLKQRFNAGESVGSTYFTLAYTYGRNIDNVSGFRQRNSEVPFYNPGLFRAVSDTDITHRISFAGGWDLPFAHYLGKNRLTEGWSLYPIISWRTGFPLDINGGLQRSRRIPGPSGAGDSELVHADLVGNGVNILNPKSNNAPTSTGAEYFLPSNFTNANFINDIGVPVAPGQGTYGTTPRNFFRGPGRGNTDLAIAKVTNLVGERVKFEFRAEMFNLFNNAHFNNPDTGINSPTFGQILSTGDPRIIQLAGRITF